MKPPSKTGQVDGLCCAAVKRVLLYKRAARCHFSSLLAPMSPNPFKRPPATQIKAVSMDPTRNVTDQSVRGRTGNHAHVSN